MATPPEYECFGSRENVMDLDMGEADGVVCAVEAVDIGSDGTIS